jgi:hypothetical protein
MEAKEFGPINPRDENPELIIRHIGFDNGLQEILSTDLPKKIH